MKGYCHWKARGLLIWEGYREVPGLYMKFNKQGKQELIWQSHSCGLKTCSLYLPGQGRRRKWVCGAPHLASSGQLCPWMRLWLMRPLITTRHSMWPMAPLSGLRETPMSVVNTGAASVGPSLANSLSCISEHDDSNMDPATVRATVPHWYRSRHWTTSPVPRVSFIEPQSLPAHSMLNLGSQLWTEDLSPFGSVIRPACPLTESMAQVKTLLRVKQLHSSVTL